MLATPKPTSQKNHFTFVPVTYSHPFSVRVCVFGKEGISVRLTERKTGSKKQGECSLLFIASSAHKACCWPPIFHYNEKIQSSESDAEFSTLCGNQNERPILEPTLRLFSTLCGRPRTSAGQGCHCIPDLHFVSDGLANATSNAFF